VIWIPGDKSPLGSIWSLSCDETTGQRRLLSSTLCSFVLRCSRCHTAPELRVHDKRESHRFGLRQ